MANPAMNTESTMETIGVVTPNFANVKRSQTTWYTRLQNPDTRKNAKNQIQIAFELREVSRCGIGYEDFTTS
jgi:hypothetical protein